MTPSPQPRTLVVVDANMSWVRSLFEAMPAEVPVYLLRVVSAGLLRDEPPTWRDLLSWRQAAAARWERTVVVPSWTRALAVSTALVRSAVAGVCRQRGHVTLVITAPHYARLRAAMLQTPAVYHVYDPFEHYGWEAERVRADEQELITTCELVTAVSRALVGDFAPRTLRPVRLLPNAVGVATLEQPPPGPRPADMPPGPVVGCVGQINASYDGALMLALARAVPHAHFMYIGPVAPGDSAFDAAVAALRQLPNVHFLGRRPHAELPRYLWACDALFNPIRPTDAADRRSLLRLYDYLATPRPILSTAVAAAYEHQAHLLIAPTPELATAGLRDMLAGRYTVDLPARLAYIQQNTWESRAKQLLALLNEHVNARDATAG